MNSGVAADVKKFTLPGRSEEFLMLGDFVYRADTKEQVFARSDDGSWIVVRKSAVQDPVWLSILENTYLR